MKIISHA
jgi:hypothetical protein